MPESISLTGQFAAVDEILSGRENLVLVAKLRHLKNPGGIADELRRRGDVRANLWAINDWSVAVPDGATAVLIGTRAYFSALARSRYLICNDHLPLPYRKRSGQRHVQTWHATPLKRIGYDIGAPKMASGTANRL